MVSDIDTITKASDICTRCGLCCSGALFDYGPLGDSEAPAAEAIGLSVQHVDGRARFCQPCAAFSGNCCSVYEARPSTCRSYRCQLLKRVHKGEVGEEDALDLITQARELESRVLALLPKGTNLASAKASFMPRLGNETQSLEWRRSNPQIAIALTLLNHLLDRHFRHSNERLIPDWGTGMEDAD